MRTHNTNPGHNATALRQMLAEREHHLQNDLRSQLSDGRTDRNAPGRDDTEVADDNAGRDMSFAVLQMKSAAVADLRTALHRLDSGTYGNCLECEQPISPQRLRAMPTAVRCQPCAERLERMGRAAHSTQAPGAAFRALRPGHPH